MRSRKRAIRTKKKRVKEALPWFEDLLKENELSYLDLSDKLQKVQGKQFAIDAHYNEKGHRALADFISESLVNDYDFEWS